MDLEKVKQNYKWNPSRGDYSKSIVSYERRVQKKKHIKNAILTALYVILLIAAIVMIYLKFK